MANRSTFPLEIDVFLEHYELSSSDVPLLTRFQVLKTKSILTSLEQDELANLTTQLRNKLMTAEDFNKLQDAITNLETFFRDETDGYVQTKQTEFEAFVGTKTTEVNTHATTKSAEITNTATNATTSIQTTKDAALIAIEQKKENVITYMDSTTAGAIRNDMGIMGDLATTDKTSLVKAINEVNTKAPADATTGIKGIVMLEDSVTSTSITKAATPKSVKSAYDLANSKSSFSGSYTDLTNKPTIPSNASQLSITDTGNYYMGANAELALQEIGSTLNAMRGNLITSTNAILGS